MKGAKDLLLKNRNFSLFWLGQVISNFGDRLTQMALIAFVHQHFPGSSLALAKLMSFTILPVFLIGPVAGAWVDRWDRKNVMITCDLLRGFLILLIPLFILMNQLVLVYAAIFLSFSVTRFFIPSRMAIIPELASEDALLVANSLADTTRVIGNAVGLVVAGLLVNIRYIGATGGFYIDSITFFISALFLGLMTREPLIARVKDNLAIARTAIGDSLRKSILGEIKEGVAYLTVNSQTRFIVRIFFLFMACMGALFCVVVVFVQESFGSATKDLAFLGISSTVGLLIGAILFGRFGHHVPKRTAMRVSIIASGIAIILFTEAVKQYPHRLIGLWMSFLIGLAASPITILVNTMVHEAIPDEARGRAFSSLEVVGHLAFIIMMFTASIAAKRIGSGWVMIGCGAIFSACGGAGLLGEMKKRRLT